MHEFTKGVDAIGAISLHFKSCVCHAHNEEVHDLMDKAGVHLHKKWLQVVVEELPVHRVHLDLHLLVAF